MLKGVTDIQTALINMLEIALFDHCHSDAEYFADLYETLIQQFCFPEWMRYQAHLQLALEKKDPAMSIFLLQKMLPAMKQEWQSQYSPLYRKATSAGATFLSSRLVDILCQELSTKEEFAFLQDTAEFQALMTEMQR